MATQKNNSGTYDKLIRFKHKDAKERLEKAAEKRGFDDITRYIETVMMRDTAKVLKEDKMFISEIIGFLILGLLGFLTVFGFLVYISLGKIMYPFTIFLIFGIHAGYLFLMIFWYKTIPYFVGIGDIPFREVEKYSQRYWEYQCEFFDKISDQFELVVEKKLKKVFLSGIVFTTGLIILCTLFYFNGIIPFAPWITTFFTSPAFVILALYIYSDLKIYPMLRIKKFVVELRRKTELSEEEIFNKTLEKINQEHLYCLEKALELLQEDYGLRSEL